MKVVNIGVGKVGVANSLTDALSGETPDVVLIARSMAEEVRLDNEIAGRTAFAAQAAALSAQCACPVLCGCGTRLGEDRRVSVMTFAFGRLVDIADRTLNLSGGDYREGDTIKILRLKNFDLGLLVDTDVLLAGNWKKIAARCDAVACIALAGNDADYGYIPTLASLFAKPYAAAFADGEIMWGNPQDD